MDYEKQAKDFLKKTGVSFKCEFVEYGKHFDCDQYNRDIYNITLTRGSRSFSFRFGQSIVNSGVKFTNKNTGKVYKTIPTDDYLSTFKSGKRRHLWHMYLKNKLPFPPGSCDTFLFPVEPTEYDVLACLTDYDPGTFEDFCSDFGYDTDSRKAEKTYNAIVDEYKNVCVIWNEDELEKLRDIN